MVRPILCRNDASMQRPYWGIIRAIVLVSFFCLLGQRVSHAELMFTLQPHFDGGTIVTLSGTGSYTPHTFSINLSSIKVVRLNNIAERNVPGRDPVDDMSIPRQWEGTSDEVGVDFTMSPIAALQIELSGEDDLFIDSFFLDDDGDALSDDLHFSVNRDITGTGTYTASGSARLLKGGQNLLFSGLGDAGVYDDDNDSDAQAFGGIKIVISNVPIPEPSGMLFSSIIVMGWASLRRRPRVD